MPEGVQVTTGAGPSRIRRKSDLLFGWRSSDLSLDAYTGQVGTPNPFIVGVVPATIEGRNGVTVTAGVGQPRWEQAAARGTITRLAVEGEVAGQVVEQYIHPFALRVQALSLYWRVWPMYTVGQNLAQVAYGPMIGQATTGGGWLGLRRIGTDWQATRKRGAVEITSTLTDVGSVFPLDVLVTMTPGGTVVLSLRDATSTRVGTGPTDVNMAITTETWGGSLFGFCGIQGLVAPGGRWWYEVIKIARGVQSFTSMDLLH